MGTKRKSRERKRERGREKWRGSSRRGREKDIMKAGI